MCTEVKRLNDLNNTTDCFFVIHGNCQQKKVETIFARFLRKERRFIMTSFMADLL